MEEVKTPHVYADIARVTSILAEVGVGKLQRNKDQGYDFRGIDDVLNAVAPALSSVGLCILPEMMDRTVTVYTSKSGGNLFNVTVKALFHFVSSVDGSRTTVTMYGEAMDSSDKGTNKAMSAAYKYCCIQAFCIPVVGDGDADFHSPEPSNIAPPTIAPSKDGHTGPFAVGRKPQPTTNSPAAKPEPDPPSKDGQHVAPAPNPVGQQIDTPTVGQRVKALMEKHGKDKDYFTAFFAGFLGVDVMPKDKAQYLPALTSLEAHAKLPFDGRLFGADCARTEAEITRFGAAIMCEMDESTDMHMNRVGIATDTAQERLAYLRVLAKTNQATLMVGIRNLAGLSFVDQLARLTGKAWTIDEIPGVDIEKSLLALASEAGVKRVVYI